MNPLAEGLPRTYSDTEVPGPDPVLHIAHEIEETCGMGTHRLIR